MYAEVLIVPQRSLNIFHVLFFFIPRFFLLLPHPFLASLSFPFKLRLSCQRNSLFAFYKIWFLPFLCYLHLGNTFFTRPTHHTKRCCSLFWYFEKPPHFSPFFRWCRKKNVKDGDLWQVKGRKMSIASSRLNLNFTQTQDNIPNRSPKYSTGLKWMKYSV